MTSARTEGVFLGFMLGLVLMVFLLFVQYVA